MLIDEVAEDLYKGIEDLLKEHKVPQLNACLKILKDNLDRFENAPGSSHNHQAWVGGYIDHLHEAMNYAVDLYRMQTKRRPNPFTLRQALFVLFLHDLEKPWLYRIDHQGELIYIAGIMTKIGRKKLREAKLYEYGISLNVIERNALNYVEGEGEFYTSERRVMNELAAFCHSCDLWSSRGWPNYPKEEGDPWPGAKRFRTNVTSAPKAMSNQEGSLRSLSYGLPKEVK